MRGGGDLIFLLQRSLFTLSTTQSLTLSPLNLRTHTPCKVVGVNQVNVVPTVALPDSSIPTFGSAATLPVSRPQQRSIIGIPCEASKIK